MHDIAQRQVIDTTPERVSSMGAEQFCIKSKRLHVRFLEAGDDAPVWMSACLTREVLNRVVARVLDCDGEVKRRHSFGFSMDDRMKVDCSCKTRQLYLCASDMAIANLIGRNCSSFSSDCSTDR